MSGSSLLFMLFSWLVVFGFVVFCLTIILREERRVKQKEPSDFEGFNGEEEIT
jgi:protein-S-isoprenylcysteine O-methyltransferase Ste14